jgi:hypothetical protein
MSMLKVVAIRFLMPSVVGGRRIAEAGIAGLTRADALPDRHLFRIKEIQGSMLTAVPRVPSRRRWLNDGIWQRRHRRSYSSRTRRLL